MQDKIDNLKLGDSVKVCGTWVEITDYKKRKGLICSVFCNKVEFFRHEIQGVRFKKQKNISL